MSREILVGKVLKINGSRLKGGRGFGLQILQFQTDGGEVEALSIFKCFFV